MLEEFLNVLYSNLSSVSTLKELRNNQLILSDYISIEGRDKVDDGFKGVYIKLKDDHITKEVADYIVVDKAKTRWLYKHNLEDDDELLNRLIVNEKYNFILFPETFGKIEKNKDASLALNKTFEYAAFVDNCIVYLSDSYVVESDLYIPKCNIKIVGKFKDMEHVANIADDLYNTRNISAYQYFESHRYLHDAKETFSIRNDAKIYIESEEENLLLFYGIYFKNCDLLKDNNLELKSKEPIELFKGNFEVFQILNSIAVGYG